MKSFDAEKQTDQGKNVPVPESPAVKPIQRSQSIRAQAKDVAQFAATTPTGAGSDDEADAQAVAADGLQGEGRRLPFVDKIQAAFGHHDISGVSARIDAHSSRAARKLGARAYATGSNIAFDGQPDLRLATHEAAHIVQQRNGVHLSGRLGQAGDRYERHADAVADAVVAGRSAEQLLDEHAGEGGHGETVVQRFEAGLHEGIDQVALTEGGAADTRFTDDEAAAAYHGNWMRDLNQLFVPAVTQVVKPALLMAALNYLSQQKFGRMMSAEMLGQYSPAEHMDNPGGLRQSDLLPQPASHGPSTPAGTAGGRGGASAGPSKPHEGVEPGSTVLGADIFSVDQNGVMAYIRRSNAHVEERLASAFETGRTTEGLMHLGAALHTVEDLFAHSNWVEIAVQKLIRDEPTLLPGVNPTEVFTFMPEVSMAGGGRRPVMTTGTFTSVDTQISIATEVVTLLRKPLPLPSEEAADAHSAFVREVLLAAEAQLQGNAASREQILALIPEDIRSRIPDGMEDQLRHIPLVGLYDLTTMIPGLPEGLLNRIRTKINNIIEAQVLKPAADALESLGVEARVADSNLSSHEQQLQTDKARHQAGQWNWREKGQQGLMQAVTGQPVDGQRKEKVADETARLAILKNTPQHVKAGPSHSQLAKDHPDSPFFGLAFHMAVIAVRRLREKVVAAWAAKSGSTAPRAAARRGDQRLTPDALQRQQRRQQVKQRGLHIMATGHDQTMTAESYDLDAPREASALEVEAAADLIDAIADGPDKIAAFSKRLSELLGDDAPKEATDLVARSGSTASSVATRIIQKPARLAELAAALDDLANSIRDADEHGEREALSTLLTQRRSHVMDVLRTEPDVPHGVEALVLHALDRQLRVIEVSYTSGQRQQLQDSAKDIKRSEVNQPALDRFGNDPALVALLGEARHLIDHPYESTWWQPHMRDWISQHGDQLRASIMARGSGVPSLRGEVDAQCHGH